MKLTCHAYAKINLLLDVTGKRADGYHEVVMLMQSISLHDVVTVEAAPGRGIEIACDMPGIPTDRRNIAWKACEAFGLRDGVRISLEKRIPSQAGLAGGSADAATVLTALRAMFAPDMPDKTLRGIGATIGADVPFCLTGGCCLAEGVGERLTPLPCLPDDYAVALVKPAVSVNTAQAYAAMDRIDLRRPRTEQAVALARRGDWESLFPLCGNVFEQVTQLPGLADAKRQALQRGAKLAQMTGSGSAVFAVYHKDTPPGGILRALGALGKGAAVYGPVSRGVLPA